MTATHPNPWLLSADQPGHGRYTHRAGCPDRGDAQPWDLVAGHNEDQLRAFVAIHAAVWLCPVCLQRPSEPARTAGAAQPADTGGDDTSWLTAEA